MFGKYQDGGDWVTNALDSRLSTPQEQKEKKKKEKKKEKKTKRKR